MRNVIMAAVVVAAGVSSSYLPKTGGSDNPTEAVGKGSKTLAAEEHLPQPIDDPMDLLKDFLDPNYQTAPPAGNCSDPIDKLRELLNSNRQPCTLQTVANNASEEKPGANCDAKGELKDESHGVKFNLNFLIATIPDPERTHLGLDFDRLMEALIFAAEEEDFSYDRYWLPWHVDHDLGNPDPLKQDVIDGRGEARHRKPGIIIFRKKPTLLKDKNTDKRTSAETSDRNLQDSRNRALVVFLVGETPTAGINRHQFKNAADYLHSFQGCSHVLGVVGPTFSGSSTSLRAAIANDLKPSTEEGLLVISGGASGRDALAGLANSTIHSDAFLWQALQIFQTTQLRIQGEVAVLKESATDFGADVNETNPRDIYYPREIYRLRNVYPEQVNTAENQVANLQQQLSLRLRDSRVGEDTLPEFSDQTPLTQETVLLQISETLRRDHVGLAVVTGTDVLDLLFLSRHLRRMSPDVRLLLWDSDLLFVHGTDTLDFSGMLALSTYPLIPGNHVWTQGSRPYYFFASNLMEGVYNACRLVLNPKATDLRDYSSPTESVTSNFPPVWLSVIGDDGYWPIGIVNDRGMDPTMLGSSKYSTGQLDPGHATRAWRSIYYLCGLLALFYLGVYLYVGAQDATQLPRWCAFLHPHPESALLWRPTYSLLMSFALLLAYLCLLVPVFRLGLGNDQSEWLPMLAAGVFVFLVFLAVLGIGLLGRSRWTVSLAVALGLGVVIFLVYSFWSGFFFNEEGFFRALRSVQIGGSVSPALPLFFLLLAFAWWASTQIQRARLVVEQEPQIPNIAANQAWLNIDRMNKCFRQGFLHIDFSGWMVALVAALITAMVAIPHVISVDGWLFDAAVCALLIPLSTLLFLTTYAFARIWRALDRVLEALESQPIRFAFSNLPSDVSWSPLWLYGARHKTYTTLIRSLQSLRKLEEANADYYPALSTDIEALDGRLKKILTAVNLGCEESVEEIKGIQTLLCGIMQRLSEVEDTQEWNKRYSESLTKLKKATGSPTVHRGSAEWLPHNKLENLKITSAPEDSEPEDLAEMLASEVIALRYLAYIRYVMRHLRNLLSFVTTGFILMTLAMNCYPFQALNLIRWSITGVFVLTGAVLLYALQRMSRSEILKRVSDIPAGGIDTGLYVRVISVGALPLLAVVASHFPSVGRFLFSWVQPAIAAIH